MIRIFIFLFISISCAHQNQKREVASMWPVSSVEVLGEQEKIVEVGKEIQMLFQVKSIGDRIGDYKLVKFYPKNKLGKMKATEVASDKNGQLVNSFLADTVGEEEIEIQSGFTSRIVFIKIVPKDTLPSLLTLKKVKGSDYYLVQGFNKNGKEVKLEHKEFFGIKEKLIHKVQAFERGFLVYIEDIKSIKDQISIKYQDVEQMFELKQVGIIEVKRLPAGF